MLELVCAIAPAANTEASAAAKRNFFTTFSVVFRCAGWATQDDDLRSYHHFKAVELVVLLHFIAGAFDVIGPLN